jgi:hypothetical protein
MAALEKVAYGSTIQEPHKTTLQSQVVQAKTQAAEKNYHDAILGALSPPPTHTPPRACPTSLCLSRLWSGQD